MNTKKSITVQQFCEHYNVPESFVNSLYDFELIEIVTIHNTPHLNISQIRILEKLIKFHYDLDINLEGIHAISNLLNTIVGLQKELKELHSKLNFYESHNM